jgi:hypothetical protein
VRAFVRAIEDETGGAGLPHFSEGDLLLTLHRLARSGAAARVVNLLKIGHRLYYPRLMQTLTLLVAVMALGVPVALADVPAGEKAELCVLCIDQTICTQRPYFTGYRRTTFLNSLHCTSLEKGSVLLCRPTLARFL